jgi:D-arabinose 1-dehydrogenase-like Zn-dependent alcohol dehydrogenase
MLIIQPNECMRAAAFEKYGLENLNIREDIKQPEPTDHDILIRVRSAGVNPIDYFVVSGSREIKTQSPHIPGAEITGIVQRIGKHVTSLKEGDRVAVYSRTFDGTCDMCLNGLEMLCRNGGIVGVVTNGGFAEYIAVPERNAFKITDDTEWDMAASLAVTSITPYHALKEASLKLNEYLVIFGASGNTGMMAIQFGNKMGAKVIAVSNDDWIRDFGVQNVISDYSKVIEKVTEITQGKMADVVLNSLGIETWDNSLEVVGINGRLVTFGGLTGADVKLNVQSLYSKQIKLIGSTGGSRKEFKDLIDMSGELKVKVWKRFKLDNAKEALQEIFSGERQGRILLDIDNTI